MPPSSFRISVNEFSLHGAPRRWWTSSSIRKTFSASELSANESCSQSPVATDCYKLESTKPTPIQGELLAIATYFPS